MSGITPSHSLVYWVSQFNPELANVASLSLLSKAGVTGELPYTLSVCIGSRDPSSQSHAS